MSSGAGSGENVKEKSKKIPMYKIGWDDQKVEAGGKVHEENTNKNYILIRCEYSSRDGTLCLLQDPNNPKRTYWLHNYELKKGWISQEELDERTRRNKEAREALEKKMKEESDARINKAIYVLKNYEPMNFGDGIMSFPAKTTFYFVENRRIKGIFKIGSHYSGGIRVFIWDVESDFGDELILNEDKIYTIPINLFTELPQFKKVEQPSSSESAAGAGAGSESVEEQEKRKCLEFLASLGINEYKDFKDWALQGHPNKGGDQELFQKVSDCMDKTFKKNSKQGGKRKTRNTKRKTRKH